jgi:hypothetical protein
MECKINPFFFSSSYDFGEAKAAASYLRLLSKL